MFVCYVATKRCLYFAGSAYDPAIVGREGLRASLSAVRPDISTGEQDACLLCRFLRFFSTQQQRVRRERQFVPVPTSVRPDPVQSPQNLSPSPKLRKSYFYIALEALRWHCTCVLVVLQFFCLFHFRRIIAFTLTRYRGNTARCFN